MPRPTLRDLVFSLKTFAAAMLALYIAFRLDLPQPSWALLTTYIVSQPLSGAVLAKSVARVFGTLAGAVASVALVAVFADAREPFVLALAFWVGACLYVSVLLRDAPASYGAMLAGYTAAIIGFPSVLSPLTAFDTAVARCTEITLGIACATLVSRLVLPLSSGAVLRRTLDASLAAAQAWAGDVLSGRGGDTRGTADRRKLIADTVALDVMRIHAGYETGHGVRRRDRIVRLLQARLLTLLAMLVSVQDRLHILARERPARAAAVAPLMERVAQSVAAGGTPGITVEAVEAHLPTLAALQRDVDSAVEHILVSRLADVLRLNAEMRRLRAALDSGEDVAVPGEGMPSVTRYRDHGLALVAGLVAATSLAVTAAFWIATGWSYGSTAAFLAAVVCSIMATQDDPAAAALNFLRMSLLSVVIAALYNFAVFPAIDGFPLFALSLGLFVVPFGLFMTKPSIAPVIMPLCLNVLALSGVKNTPGADFADFLNGALSLVIGIAISVGMFRLLRPISVDWTIGRLVAGLRRDLAQIAVRRTAEPRSLFESRMFDRISGLMARLGAQDENHRPILQGALASLRVGLNILWLRRLGEDGLPAGLAVPIDHALDALSVHFRRPGAALLPRLDHSIAAVQAHGVEAGGPAVAVLVALAGIRTSLAEHAAFFALGGADLDAAPATAAEVTP